MIKRGKNGVWVLKHKGASRMRLEQNHYLKDYTRDIDISSVVNLGAKPDSPDKQGSTYEKYFPDAVFHTFDLDDDNHERHFKVDLMEPPTGVRTYDLVLAMSLIEHIDRPWIAARNMSALISPGGHMYIAMPFFYPVHEGTYFGDHWRATPSAMPFLFEDLEVVRTDLFASSICAIRDRRQYWEDDGTTYTGFSMLMRKPG